MSIPHLIIKNPFKTVLRDQGDMYVTVVESKEYMEKSQNVTQLYMVEGKYVRSATWNPTIVFIRGDELEGDNIYG